MKQNGATLLVAELLEELEALLVERCGSVVLARQVGHGAVLTQRFGKDLRRDVIDFRLLEHAFEISQSLPGVVDAPQPATDRSRQAKAERDGTAL